VCCSADLIPERQTSSCHLILAIQTAGRRQSKSDQSFNDFVDSHFWFYPQNKHNTETKSGQYNYIRFLCSWILSKSLNWFGQAGSMYSVLCSLLTVVIHVTKARGPVARSGKLYPYRSQRATPDASNVMAFDIEEDSVNEKQFLQRIASRINSESHGRHRSHSNTKAEGTSRTKRSIFGPDNRINVGTSVQAQRYPYSTVVTLSSGCTGTLIGAQHVLTAAHCVHDGKRFLSRARKLKIGMFPICTYTNHFVLLAKHHGSRLTPFGVLLIRILRFHQQSLSSIIMNRLNTVAIKGSTLSDASIW